MICRTITCPICGGEGGAIVESGYTQHGPGFGAATPNERSVRCDACCGDGEVDTCLPDEFFEAADYDPAYIEYMLEYAETRDNHSKGRLNEKQLKAARSIERALARNERGRWE